MFDREDTPVLQVLNGTKSMEHNGALCLNCYDNTSYAEIPFTLINTGEGTLTVSNIEGFLVVIRGYFLPPKPPLMYSLRSYIF